MPTEAASNLLRDFGLPIFLVVCFMAFFWKGFWPWMTKQVDVAQQQAIIATSALSEIKQTLVVQNEISREVVELLRTIRARGDRPHAGD